MYGIGAYFALRNAIKAFNPNGEITYDTPMTPEKVLMNLYAKKIYLYLHDMIDLANPAFH